MALPAHTYGPSCTLHSESNIFTRRASEISMDPPKVRAHFFYSSALPIDDPLSPVAPPSSGSSAGPSKVPPRPFSIYDSTALEEAWQIIQATKRVKKERKRSDSDQATREPKNPQGSARTHDSGVDEVMYNTKSTTEKETSNTYEDSNVDIGGQGEKIDATVSALAKTNIDVALVNDDAPGKGPQKFGDPHLTLCDDPHHIPFDEAMPVGSEEIGNDEFESGMPYRRHRTPFRRKDKHEKASSKETAALSKSLPKQKSAGYDAQYGSSPSERDTTGTPFLRVPSRLRRSRSQSPQPSKHRSNSVQYDGGGSASEREAARATRSKPFRRAHSNFSDSQDSDSGDDSEARTDHLGPSPRHKPKSPKAHITVGVSRLHVVELPNLRMGPIYWDPIHDVCSVVRGTWFYKDTMMPVESEVANQIEEGYEYMKPWTPAYADELNSCIETGADAELKIVHRLWPVDVPGDVIRPATAKTKLSLLGTTTSKLEPDDQKRKRAILAAQNPENRAAGVLDGKDNPVRLYAKSSLIFANARDAQILRPNLLPSVARGRRPLGAIRKGRSIGIPVVRGFDYKTWEKLHPASKRASTAFKSGESVDAGRVATMKSERRKSCAGCLTEETRPKATDLVLVIHGIGQKLSERVESFHFTHAINAFRRQINKELEVDAVKPWLRQDLGGIMVLPINWRSTLKLEDGGPEPNPNRKDNHSSKNQFNLKDITAESIPAVRNLISDVMLDIPYYLSHHKKKMVEAVILEANRVYRLWCRNNPGFEEGGRVHLIAHSLGSVMALDILSKQPTNLPEDLDLRSKKPRNDIFEFDTKGLFFCGSPAGFFLLLHRAPLLPRKGREKPGADGEDLRTSLTGEAGTYGCLAVDNLYNVMHYNDPIAYRLNACVDVDYAASLQPASVPSATSTWMQSISSVFRSRAVAPTIPTSTDDLDEFLPRPSVIKLPSTLEMETHDFTREEIAEKRMFLLNDNGQIDYTLHSGGGPLEIQYLNMLSAHSSYWTLQDFVRFLVVEIGRKGGKQETVAAMKAVKKIRGKG